MTKYFELEGAVALGILLRAAVLFRPNGLQRHWWRLPHQEESSSELDNFEKRLSPRNMEVEVTT